MVRKFIALFLSMVLVISLSGCGSSDSSKVDNEKNVAADDQGEDKQNSDSSEPTEAIKEEESSTAESLGTALSADNTVLYDQDGFKVTAVSFGEDDYGDPELKVSIENTSDKDVTFQIDDASVNGYMNSPLFSVDVTAGNSANDSIIFYTDSLTEGGIKDITSIEFKILVLDTATFDTISESDTITVNTGAADGGVYDTTGEVVYEDNDIKIISQYLTTDDVMGEEIVFYIENNSDKEITVQNNSVSINGTMIEALLICSVLPGKKAVTEMSFSGLEDNGITEITDAEFSLNIYDTESYDTIADTESISLTFE